MKKSVSFLTCLLTFPLVFASCGGEKDARVKKATISTFSSYEEMQTFNYYNSFGKIGVNTDPKFITDGNTSARVEIHGNPKGNDPSMYIWCDTKYFSANDFSYVKALTMDVFNESGRETKLTLSFTSRKNKLRKTYPGTEYLLSPGKNNLVYYIDRQVAKYLCDIDALEYIRFDFAQTDSFDTFSLLYLDNLEAHYEYTETERQRPKLSMFVCVLSENFHQHQSALRFAGKQIAEGGRRRKSQRGPPRSLARDQDRKGISFLV